jgi:hypothetical protein
MVVLAFLVPVALVITPLARDRAIAAAESQAAALKAVLAITTDPAAVAKAVDAGESPERVALYGLPPKTLGQGRAAPGRPGPPSATSRAWSTSRVARSTWSRSASAGRAGAWSRCSCPRPS